MGQAGHTCRAVPPWHGTVVARTEEATFAIAYMSEAMRRPGLFRMLLQRYGPVLRRRERHELLCSSCRYGSAEVTRPSFRTGMPRNLMMVRRMQRLRQPALPSRKRVWD